MSKVQIDRRERLFVEGFKHFFSLNPESLSPEEIKIMNNTSYPQRIKNRYLVHTNKGISVTTYIIPVSDGGTVTAYYLVNPKIQDKRAMPLVVYFHGGGWFHSNMDFYSTYLKYLANKMEVAILLIDYRLGSQYKFPTAFEDCFDSFIWAEEGVKYWKIDPDQIYIAGDGFGATLAASTTLLLRDRKEVMPSGTLLLYPLTDCRLRTQSMETFKETPVLTQKMISWYIKNYSRETKDSLSPLMSPLLTQDLSRLPSTLIIASEKDPLLDDSLLYSEALIKATTKAKVLVAPSSLHGFMPFRKANGREEAESAIWQFVHGKNVETISFLKRAQFRSLLKRR